MKNLATSLFMSEKIITSIPKAKELRRVAEPLITLAKEDGVHGSHQPHVRVRRLLRRGFRAAHRQAPVHGRRRVGERGPFLLWIGFNGIVHNTIHQRFWAR